MSQIRAALCLVLLLLLSCNGQPDTLLHQYQRVRGSDGWSRTDTLAIPLPAVRETGIYAFDIGLRHLPDYPYQGLTAVVQLQLQNPDVVFRDTVELATNDAVTARPLGQGNALPTVEHTVNRLQLYRGQHGTLRIYHLMYHSPLPAITHVGAKVTKEES